MRVTMDTSTFYLLTKCVATLRTRRFTILAELDSAVAAFRCDMTGTVATGDADRITLLTSLLDSVAATRPERAFWRALVGARSQNITRISALEATIAIFLKVDGSVAAKSFVFTNNAATDRIGRIALFVKFDNAVAAFGSGTVRVASTADVKVKITTIAFFAFFFNAIAAESTTADTFVDSSGRAATAGTAITSFRATRPVSRFRQWVATILILDDENNLGVVSPVRTGIVIHEGYRDTETIRSTFTLESHILNKSASVRREHGEVVEGVAAVVATTTRQVRTSFSNTIGTGSPRQITIVTQIHFLAIDVDVRVTVTDRTIRSGVALGL